MQKRVRENVRRSRQYTRTVQIHNDFWKQRAQPRVCFYDLPVHEVPFSSSILVPAPTSGAMAKQCQSSPPALVTPNPSRLCPCMLRLIQYFVVVAHGVASSHKVWQLISCSGGKTAANQARSGDIRNECHREIRPTKV